jgi:hypothetical protein
MSDEEDRSALEALAALGLDMDDMAEAEAELEAMGARRKRSDRDGRICICGHPVARHTDSGIGISLCKPSRMECPCKKCRPALEASDIRQFMRKTWGGGSLHALSLGIAAQVKSGRSVKWIVDIQCDRCKTASGEIVPVPVSQTGHAMTEATGYDVFLCRDCRAAV